ncbi:hypothetical protein BpHYR1_043219 [Brachionus plicatilis]|uniref:Uncharacterized protein n=1 Tax=Brachionus plicatilis TaxID=10195 RepID=A0A3M7QQL9_BRAPC|nr:hypothetical protein BpHYR1_043219 [Brachionus plicatilis]
MSFINDGGDSCTLWLMRNLLFTYSKNLFINIKKCSAWRILPGTASSRMSFGKMGLANAMSVSRTICASFRPSTNFLYSLFNLSSSCCFNFLTCLVNASKFSPARCSKRLLRLRLMESMHTLSMLCASSNTTTDSLGMSLDTISAILGSSR